MTTAGAQRRRVYVHDACAPFLESRRGPVGEVLHQLWRCWLLGSARRSSGFSRGFFLSFFLLKPLRMPGTVAGRREACTFLLYLTRYAPHITANYSSSTVKNLVKSPRMLIPLKKIRQTILSVGTHHDRALLLVLYRIKRIVFIKQNYGSGSQP